jgi:CRP-like cAMP-binding protein
MLSETHLQLLLEVPFLRQVEPTARARLATEMTEVSFLAGEEILKVGQDGGRLYLISKGLVKVHLQDLCLAELGVGSYFGEMSLFDGEPASATVTALTPTTCLCLDRPQMQQVLMDTPAIGLSLLRNLASRIRRLDQRLSAWVRGLLTVAWADQEYSHEEKQVIETLIHEELYPHSYLGQLTPISAPDLAEQLGGDPSFAENFLRMAMIVALANGTYSLAEDQKLREFCQALEQPTTLLDQLQTILITPTIREAVAPTGGLTPPPPDLLQPVRQWLDHVDVHSPHTAKFLCKLIPSQCPFERDIVLFGRKIVHVPPMCKLNPFYEQVVGIRFRALSYLADVCHEDITPYIQ